MKLGRLRSSNNADNAFVSTIIVFENLKTKLILYTVYDRIDAAATINFSTQFGAATIRERRHSRAASISFGAGTG